MANCVLKLYSNMARRLLSSFVARIRKLICRGTLVTTAQMMCSWIFVGICPTSLWSFRSFICGWGFGVFGFWARVLGMDSHRLFFVCVDAHCTLLFLYLTPGVFFRRLAEYTTKNGSQQKTKILYPHAVAYILLYFDNKWNKV